MIDFEQATPALRVALVARFLVELALLAGAAVAAWCLTPGAWGWATAVIAPLAVAVLWGAFLSPRATVPLPAAAKLLIETLLFAAVGFALSCCGLGTPALVGVAAWAADRLAIAALSRQRG